MELWQIIEQRWKDKKQWKNYAVAFAANDILDLVDHIKKLEAKLSAQQAVGADATTPASEQLPLPL